QRAGDREPHPSHAGEDPRSPRQAQEAARGRAERPEQKRRRTITTAYSVHARDLMPGDHLPHGNWVVRTLPWPNGDVDVEIAFADGVLERFRYKPAEWITIVRDTEEE